MIAPHSSSGAAGVCISTLLALLMPAFACSAQHEEGQEQVRAVEVFVKEFYVSYRARVESQMASGTPAWALVANEPDSALTAALALALSADHEAALASPGEIVGLDFDPFLAAQDLCDAYRVGRVVAQTTGFRAEVYGDCGRNDGQVPDVVAEVVLVNGTYRIANVRYPTWDMDLMTLLSGLQDGRDQS